MNVNCLLATFESWATRRWELLLRKNWMWMRKQRYSGINVWNNGNLKWKEWRWKWDSLSTSESSLILKTTFYVKVRGRFNTVLHRKLLEQHFRDYPIMVNEGEKPKPWNDKGSPTDTSIRNPKNPKEESLRYNMAKETTFTSSGWCYQM